jgi:hypothetical protein
MMAKPCKKCNQYYPGDCYTDGCKNVNCKCDGCVSFFLLEDDPDAKDDYDSEE